ncbi:ATP-binding protein [Desulfitobacterium metallireducens]|uniref:histidine kinase n=1 Tax=Desulfitobacterium metallireducens DSM 15288 TaxID=871968 RepID=W0EBL3_9FIRM|nr:ATP-binding protein [Desulfitobacterium metallireducens]AHF06594.1 histidine kinase [Desulfitobacterium metallireducens DSM 15288]
MFRKTITFKLTAGFVVIVLISMLTIGLFFIQMFRQYTFDSKEQVLLERARSISELFSENPQSSSQMRGYGGLMKVLGNLAEAKVWITDDKGNPAAISGTNINMGMGNGMGGKGGGLGNSAGNGIGQAFSKDPLPAEAENVITEVLAGKESISENFSGVYNEATLTVGVPIRNSDQNVVGAVLLHSPVTGITETIDKAIHMLEISLLAALILATGLGIFYSLLFTRPLKAMNRTAVEMTRGNYATRTGIKREDELGQLGNSLDQLAEKLGYTIDQLFQEKGKISDIIASISEGIVAFDLNFNSLSINSALSEIMNQTLVYSNEGLKKDFEALAIYDSLERVIMDKKSLQVLKDWKGKKLRFTLSPIIDNQNKVTGSVALVQDISESERLEQLRKDFVANVSHEFRTPLTVIKGSVEALMDGTVDQTQDIEHYYQRMLAETKGLERLVGDLLELSRLQSGKISIHQEEIYLPGLISDVIKSLQTLADKKEIQIVYQGLPNVPVLNGDYDRLRQLFVIFIDNAVKYSHTSTVITVELNVIKDSTLQVKIKDQGYGIPQEELPYVWDRFYKADKSRQSKGTGLGLAIAKHLVQLHQGQVFMTSEEGKGTTVTVQLPLNICAD